MKINITKAQRQSLIHACKGAIAYEESFIDAYKHVDDGSQKEPVGKAKILIRKWQKLIEYLRSYES